MGQNEPQQLAFSWHSRVDHDRQNSVDAASERSNEAAYSQLRIDTSNALRAPKHVTFTVQNANSSPRRRQSPKNAKRVPHSSQSPSPLPRATVINPPAVITTATDRGAVPARTATRSARKQPPSTAATKSSKPDPIRRPAWDADVKTPGSVFDSSLKKTVLFRARPGERKQVIQEEVKRLRDRVTSSKVGRPSSAPVNKWKARAEVPKPHATSVSTMIRRPPKDFVRLNFEKVTGRPFQQALDLERKRQLTQRTKSARSTASVFDRLATPRNAPTLLRSSTQPTVQTSTRISPRRTLQHPQAAEYKTGTESPTPSSPRSSRSVRISPVNSLQRPSPNQDSASIASSPRSEHRWNSSPMPSSSSHRRSRSPSSRAPPRSPQTSNYAARVFEVLDRSGAKQIGVSQILQGLKLLGLPATHNQVSDYVYLIHEGARTTIGCEEWEILVNTLTAASPPAVDNGLLEQLSEQSQPSPGTARSRSPTAGSHRGSPSVAHHNAQASPPRSVSAPSSARKSSPAQQSSSVQRWEPSIEQTEFTMETLQRRIDEMVERAESALLSRLAAYRQETSQPQQSVDTDGVLKHAASAVYSLKSTLFPLVQQAEETLKQIQRYHGKKLSLILQPRDLKKVAEHSDLLADAILDDLLLDTVDLLNAEERRRSYEQMQESHLRQLDAIMERVAEIEQADKQLMDKGWALGFSSSPSEGYEGPFPDVEYSKRVERETARTDTSTTPQVIPKPMQHRQQTGLVLPLGAVMPVDPGMDDSVDHSIRNSGGNIMDVIDDASTATLETANRLLRDRLVVVKEPRVIAPSVLEGGKYTEIEKRRQKFLKHRRLVESSLEHTGVNQADVIDILSDMLLEDLLEDCGRELETGVSTLADTLATTLI